MSLFKSFELRNSFLNYDMQQSAFSWESEIDYAKRKLKSKYANFESGKTYDIFLSHSFKDAPIIYEIAKTLESQNLTVYVDWIEDGIQDRSKVTLETANRIRTRLKSAKSFILALTSNSAESKWVQWELGIADGQKNGRVAILPVIQQNDTNETFHKNEYLGLYPFIDTTGVSIYVNGISTKHMNLKSWISESDPLQTLMR